MYKLSGLSPSFGLQQFENLPDIQSESGILSFFPSFRPGQESVILCQTYLTER